MRIQIEQQQQIARCNQRRADDAGCGALRGLSRRVQKISLITGSLVNHVLEWLSIAKTLEILDELVHSQIEPAYDVVGRMRRQQHVRQTIEGMLRGQGLSVENVQCRSVYASLLECRDQGRLRDHWPS